MLLDRPQGPAESRGFVHKRIIGAVGGFIGGGPGGAVRGFLGGGGSSRPTIPTGRTDFTVRNMRAPVTQCPDGSRRTSRGCERAGPVGAIQRFLPGGSTGMVEAVHQAEFVGYAHHPHEPAIVATSVRRCDRGHVLSWQGLCVSKRDIRNSDRMYPKPPKPLGTRTQLKAVRVASAFGRSLKANDKRLKKLARSLGGR